MSHKLLDGATAIGASRGIKVGEHNTHHSVLVQYEEIGATAVSALVVNLLGCPHNEGARIGVVGSPAIAIGSTPENVANGAFTYLINGTPYKKAAVTAGTELPVGYTVAASKFGIIHLYINAAGTITFGFPAAAQSYATAVAAIAAASLIVTDSTGVDVNSLCFIGRVLIVADVGGWTANTDDMTDASDLTTAHFTDAMKNWFVIATVTFGGADFTAQYKYSATVDSLAKWVCVDLTSLTGTAKINVHYMGNK